MKKINLEKLKGLRIKNGFTQEAIAKLLGYESVYGYHYLESGRVQIKAEQIPILANLYNVPMEEFFCD